MVAGNQDINIDQAATFRLELTLKQADGTPFNLENYVPQAQIRKSPGAPDVEAEFECSVLSAQDGILRLDLTAVQTKDLVDIEYYYDVVIRYATEEIRVLSGIVNVSPAVTLPVVPEV